MNSLSRIVEICPLQCGWRQNLFADQPVLCAMMMETEPVSKRLFF